MPEDKSPLEQALDLFVYAPLGFALTAREELPKLAEKGRERLTGQVTMAKMVGQMVVAQGQKEAEKAVRRLVSTPAPSAGPAPAPSPAPVPPTAAVRPPERASASGNGAGLPPVDQLAIPGYDSLSASQVVQRLAGLSPAELDAVSRYESATRHRKTVLTRVSQLQSGA